MNSSFSAASSAPSVLNMEEMNDRCGRDSHTDTPSLVCEMGGPGGRFGVCPLRRPSKWPLSGAYRTLATGVHAAEGSAQLLGLDPAGRGQLPAPLQHQQQRRPLLPRVWGQEAGPFKRTHSHTALT